MNPTYDCSFYYQGKYTAYAVAHAKTLSFTNDSVAMASVVSSQNYLLPIRIPSPRFSPTTTFTKILNLGRSNPADFT